MEDNPFLSRENKIFLTSAVILAILSLIGGVWLFRSLQKPQTETVTSQVAGQPESIPTQPPEFLPTGAASPTQIPSLTPVVTAAAATPSVSPIPTLKSTPAPSSSVAVTPTPKPSVWLNFKSDKDHFSVSYDPKRKPYQDAEASGNRYTFYLPAGNFAVHAGSAWSWTNPDRNFTTDFLIDSHPSFRYEVSTQTVVDVQYNGKDYTIQCVHNGVAALKAECEQFLSSFKFQ